MSGYDLYILAGQRWTLHTSFEEDEQERALETAIDMKQTGANQAIYLLWPRYGKILYEYVKGGKADYSYKEISEIIEKDGQAPGTGATAFGEKVTIEGGGGAPRTVPRMNIKMKETVNQPQPSDPSTMPLLIGIGGLVVAGIIFLTLSSQKAGLGTSVISIGMVLGVAGLVAQQMYRTGVEKNLAILREIELQKHKDAAKAMLRQMVETGKALRWDKKAGKMQGDTHFAMVLYLAGANAAAAERNRFKKDALHSYFEELLGQLNIPAAQGQKFLSNVKEYLLYPRYHAMYDAGYEDGEIQLSNPNAQLSLEVAFTEWEKQRAETSGGAVTTEKTAAVMFTDIENYTASVQEYGNDWLVDVVKAHNEIIRAVLKTYRGREIKHTGDGIMASFTSVQDAVRAAMAIQKGIHHFSANMPTRAFKVRVGISDGEPVHLDGDIFGTPVNLAARVMAKVNGTEIALSERIPAMCESLNLSFVEMPNQELKGFSEPQSIFKLEWSDANSTEAKPPPSSTEQTVAAKQTATPAAQPAAT